MRVFALLALVGLNPFAFALESADDTASNLPPIDVYRYDMKLDVAHVISTTDVSNVCGVTATVMTYEDHQGHKHRLQYQVLGGGCIDG